MELIITIISAIAAVVAAVYVVRNDKAHIKKRIRQKRDKISQLETQIHIKYRNSFWEGSVSPEQEKINKLNQEIRDLEDRL